MSGKGANPFNSAWLESTGETPIRAVANLLLAGRPDELSDSELVDARLQGLAEYKARNQAALTDHETLRLAAVAEELSDPAIVAAKAAVRGTSGQAADDALADLRAAQMANSAWAALEAQMVALRAARKPGPDEADLLLVVAEMRRRGI